MKVHQRLLVKGLARLLKGKNSAILMPIPAPRPDPLAVTAITCVGGRLGAIDDLRAAVIKYAKVFGAQATWDRIKQFGYKSLAEMLSADVPAFELVRVTNVLEQEIKDHTQ